MNKGLEALKVIYDLEDLQGGRDDFWNAYRIIEKELKGLEIIKKLIYKVDFIDNDYYLITIDEHWIKITKRTYNLLKEVLL